MAEKEMMSWDRCLQEYVKKVSKDKDKAKALLKMANLRYEFWTGLRFKPKYTSIAVDGYYEVIKELLTALLSLEGYKSENHECLISYLAQYYPAFAYEIGIIYQLKKIRNNIDYKGFFVKTEYLKRNELEFKHIIKTLQKIIENKLK